MSEEEFEPNSDCPRLLCFAPAPAPGSNGLAERDRGGSPQDTRSRL